MQDPLGPKFGIIANEIMTKPTRMRTVAIDAALYQSYLTQYESGRAFCAALYAVINNDDHKKLMRESHALRYSLPDERDFMRRLSEYQRFLRRCQPYEVEARPNGRVNVPVRTARAMQYLPARNRDFSTYVYNAVMRTDYLLRFSELRRTGREYTGPTALQQMVEVILAVAQTDNMLRRRKQQRLDI